MGGSAWRVHVVPKELQSFQRVYGRGVGEGQVAEMSFKDFKEKSLKDPHYAYYMPLRALRGRTNQANK